MLVDVLEVRDLKFTCMLASHEHMWSYYIDISRSQRKRALSDKRGAGRLTFHNHLNENIRRS